jgi:hypothetical protein
VSLETEVPLLRIGEPEREVSVSKGDGSFFVVELEVDTGSGGFDVGETWSGAGLFLGSGGNINVRGVEEDALKVPLPCRSVDEVDAGLVGEADGGELDAAAPERAEAEGDADGAGADNWLGAKGGVLVDNEVFEGEAGEREEIETDLFEMDGAAETIADAVGDALLIAAEVDKRRKQDEEKDCQSGKGQVEKAAERMGAERRWDVCVHDFALLPGWIHFLHEFPFLSCQLSVLSC